MQKKMSSTVVDGESSILWKIFSTVEGNHKHGGEIILKLLLVSLHSTEYAPHVLMVSFKCTDVMVSLNSTDCIPHNIEWYLPTVLMLSPIILNGIPPQY